MSNTVFLDPVSPDKKTVLLQIRNTSDKPDLSFEEDIKNAVTQKGYQVVYDPDQAHYIVQANVLSVGRVREGEAFASLNGGFGATLQGVGLGAGIGAFAGNTGGGMLAGGLIGGALSTIGDAMVEVMTFNIVTDIQISEKAPKGVVVKEDSEHFLKQGTSGGKTSVFHEDPQWKRYQTRIVSSARQANLKFEEALPELKKGLIYSLSGLL